MGHVGSVVSKSDLEYSNISGLSRILKMKVYQPVWLRFILSSHILSGISEAIYYKKILLYLCELQCNLKKSHHIILFTAVEL